MASTIPTETLLSALQWRYATKGFTPGKPIPEPTLAALEQALVLSPSSFGLQPWKFLVIRDPAVRAKLREAAWNQPQVTDASAYVVIATRTEITPADVEKLINATAQAAGAPTSALDAYKQMILGFTKMPGLDTAAWSQRQGYIALGFLLSSAALLGVDACPMEGFDPARYDEILGLKGSGYHATVTAALGYRSPDDKSANRPKVRYPASELVQRI